MKISKRAHNALKAERRNSLPEHEEAKLKGNPKASECFTLEGVLKGVTRRLPVDAVLLEGVETGRERLES